MVVLDPAFTAAAGATSLALGSALWAMAQRRTAQAKIRALTVELKTTREREAAAHASTEAFDSAFIVLSSSEDGKIVEARAAAGLESLSASAQILGLPEDAPAAAVLQAVMRSDPEHARRVRPHYRLQHRGGGTGEPVRVCADPRAARRCAGRRGAAGGNAV
jgi:hypothetical protein